MNNLNNSSQLWFSSTVFHGDQEGRQIGFPTLNLDTTLLDSRTKQGVYAATVEVSEKMHMGALYYGPRTVHNELTNVLEIFLLDFNQEIYDTKVRFCLKKFIRPVIHFNSLSELQKQLQTDIEMVRADYENK